MKKDIKHSIQFITDKTGKQSGFKAPKNYFDDVEGAVFTKITLKNEKEPFNVPSNYFENLEDTLLSKVNSETKKGDKVISIRKKIQELIPMAVAASIVLFIGINFYSNQKSDNSFDTISSTDVESWYENGYVFSDETVTTMALASIDLDEDEFISVQTNDVEEYLNSIDNTFFLNEIQ